MMKKAGSSKSISSPGRTDKFPPPLMRFLRSNVSSKSRRTKSPMLIMRNKNNNTKLAIETTQEEPTSPKVTCIGQVRVARRSSNTGSRRRSISVRKQQQQQHSTTSCCCCCCNLSIKLQYLMSSLRLVLKKQVCCCFQCGEKVEAINKVQSQHIRVSTSSSTTAAGTESIENNNVAAVSGDNMNPPKDALILTRCRSAPYRSSSLASRFWGSPLNHHTSDSPESQSPQNYIREPEEEEDGDAVKSPLPVLENPILPKSDESEEEMKSSINEGSSKDKEKNGGGGTYDVHPLLLTRCKSEPARTGERLNPRRFSELDSQS